MNVVDGLCVLCEQPTRYDGTIPIICQSCRSKEVNAEPRIPKVSKNLVNDGIMGMLITRTLTSHRTNP